MSKPEKEIENKININLDLDKLKKQLNQGQELTKEFSESLKKNIGMTLDEFVKMRGELNKMGVEFKTLEKMTSDIQKAYLEELKKTQAKREEIRKEGKAKEAEIEADFLAKYNKLTDDEKKVGTEKYKELLNEKKTALENHHAEMAVKIKQYDLEIKKEQENAQNLSLDSIRDYYGKIGHIANVGLTKVSEYTKIAIDKINEYLPVNDPAKKAAEGTGELADAAKEQTQKISGNAWTKAAKEITQEYKLGLDQMTKYYDEQQVKITNKYKKKRAELKKQSDELQKPIDALENAEEEKKISDKRIKDIKAELKKINEDRYGWNIKEVRAREREEDKKPAETTGQTTTGQTGGQTTTGQTTDQTTPGQTEGQTTPGQTEGDTTGGNETGEPPVTKPKDPPSDPEEKKAKDEQAEERKKYLEEKLKQEEEHNAALEKIKTESQNKIDELDKHGFKTARDLKEETAKLNQQELDEKAKIEKKKQKLKKQAEKIAYVEGLKEKTVGIINAISSTSEGAAKALAKGPVVGPILAAMITAKGAVEVAILTSQLARYKATASPEKAERGGFLQGRRHRDGGMRIEGTNIEVEGGEFVINRRSTAKNLGLLEYINANDRPLNPTELMEALTSRNATQVKVRHHLEDGGQVPLIETVTQNNNEQLLEAIRQIKLDSRVSVTDILSAQDNYTRVEKWVGF